MDLTKLKQHVAAKKNEKKSNMTTFENIVAVYLGVEPTEYFKKVGTDANGKPIKAETKSGYTYTFSEVGTSKVVKVVTTGKFNIDLMKLVSISGQGYDIRQANLLFIQEKAKVVSYE